MVFETLGNIIGGSIRALARNLFPGFYERGISANKALAELRDLGLGYRRQDFLNDFRVGASLFDQATKVRFVNEDKTPSQGILQPLYHGVPDKYSFVFKASGTSLEDGSSQDQFFFYHRNSLDTRQSMEEDAQDYFSSRSGAYGLDVESVSLSEGYINPVWA